MTGVDVTVDGDATRIDFAGVQALRSREAGYSIARKCLDVQAEAESQDPSLRTESGVILHPEARSWFVGTLGEIEVGRMLDALPPEWLVLHSVPIGAKSTDVDHVLIGPAGVFVINTKHHAKASVWIGDRAERVGGTIQHYAERSISEARNVAGRLGRRVGATVAVNSVIALVGTRNIKDSRPAAQRPVAFVPADDLVRWLSSLPAVLTPAELGLLHLAAEEPSTWHIDPRAADTMRVMPRFERLRADVERLSGGGSARPTRGTAHGASGTSSRRLPDRSRRPNASGTSPRRAVLTAILSVVALAVAIPAVIQIASFAASNPTEVWIGVVVLVGFVGLVAGKPTRRRKRRRR